MACGSKTESILSPEQIDTVVVVRRDTVAVYIEDKPIQFPIEEKIIEEPRYSRFQLDSAISQNKPRSQQRIVYPLDEKLSKLLSTELLFVAPNEAIEREPFVVTLTLFPPTKTVTVPSNPTKQIIKDTTKVSNIMEANLRGDGFDIHTVDSVKAFSGITPTTWSWTVTPRRNGRQNLTLRVLAHIDVDNKTIEHTLQTYSKEIIVKVTPGSILKDIGDFIRLHWQWLFGVIVLPLLAPIARKIFTNKNQA